MHIDLGEVTETGRRADTDSTANSHDELFGVSVTPLTPDRAAKQGLSAEVHGLVVEVVTPESRAATAGLQAGDVIEEINRQPASEVEQLRAAVNRRNGRPTLLLVNREGRELFLTARAS